MIHLSPIQFRHPVHVVAKSLASNRTTLLLCEQYLGLYSSVECLHNNELLPNCIQRSIDVVDLRIISVALFEEFSSSLLSGNKVI